MPRYRFQAIDARGARSAGERFADSPEELARHLDNEGFSILEMETAEELVQPLHDGPALSNAEAGELAQHLADLTKSGLPLPNGLAALAQELPRGRLRKAVEDLAKRLERGEPLDAAVESLKRRFPGHFLELVTASVRSGRVGVVLADFVTYSRIGASLRQAVWYSLAYPAFALSAFIALAVFLCVAVVDSFAVIFRDFGIALPIMTRILINLSTAVTQRAWQVALTPVIVVIVIGLGSRFLLDRVSRRRMICFIPLFGVLWRWTALAEFCHYLGLLVESNVPLDRAVVLAGEGCGDAELAVDSVEIAERIRAHGASLGEASEAGAAIPEAFRKLLHWAEGRQSLSRTLHLIGEIFESQARARAGFVTTVVTVITVIVVLWGVSFIMASLFLPLIQLIARLSG